MSGWIIGWSVCMLGGTMLIVAGLFFPAGVLYFYAGLFSLIGISKNE